MSDRLTTLHPHHALVTPQGEYVRAALSDFTNTTDYVLPADTLARPATGSQFAWIQPGAGMIHEIIFFGSDADGETGTVFVVAATPIAGQTPTNGVQWVYTTLAEVAVTLGERTGVANGLITASHLYADNITITNDYSLDPVGARVIARNNDVARLYVDAVGPQMIGLHFDVGTAASMNALVRAI